MLIKTMCEIEACNHRRMSRRNDVMKYMIDQFYADEKNVVCLTCAKVIKDPTHWHSIASKKGTVSYFCDTDCMKIFALVMQHMSSA
jgi:hypothetical protein